MEASRWQQLSAHLDALLEMPADARAAYLAQVAQEDAALVDELRALLAQEATEDSLLDTPLLTAPPGPRQGEEVGPYRLDRLLGEGGMGQVWLAERADGLYQRQVALKLLRPGLADPNLRLRFTREQQILARLAHPHIARLLDAGISQSGQPYLALEKVEGQGLLDYCRSRQVGLRQRLHLFRQVCAAVSHAHANLVVHRDLKPSNILVTAEGEVRLLDFGIAKLLDGDAADPPEATHTGMRSFTLHYAAPEQIRGEPVTTQTDVYSLGVVLYELLTGEKPYRLKRETAGQWEEAILAGEPLRPSLAVARSGGAGLPEAERKRWAWMLAGDIDNIVLKALEKQPQARYPSVEALSLDIQRHLDGLPVLARPQSLLYRLRKLVRRQRWSFALGSLALASLLALLLAIWNERQQAVRETARAQALQDFVIDLFENAGVAASGKVLDVESLVDAGEVRGERELAQQPRAHAELLGVIARIRIALGQYPQAEQRLQQQQTLLQGMTDAPPALVLDAATQRGRLQRLQQDAAGCIDTLQPVFARARALQAQLPALVSEYYSQLARCQGMLGQREAARRLFEQSLSLRRSVLADDVGVVENLSDLAGLSLDAGDWAQALSGFQAALAQLRQIAGPRHRLAIDILREIGVAEEKIGRTSAAARSYGEALQLSDELLGPGHPGTLALRQRQALLLLETGELAAAEALLQTQAELILTRHGSNSAEAAGVQDALGQVAHARGELEKAHAHYLRAARIWRDLKNNTALADTLERDAAVLLEAGREAAALQVLADTARLHEVPRFSALLLRARILMQLGQDEAAAALLDAAQAQQPNSLETRILRARLQLREDAAGAGQRAAARASLEAIAAQAVADERSLHLHWQARAALLAEACRESPEPSRAAFEKLLQTMAQLRPEGGLLQRQIKAEAARCRSRVPLAGAG